MPSAQGNPHVPEWGGVIRRRTANGILPLSLLSSRSLLSPRCQLQTCEFPLLHLSSLSLPLISILATPMQPCSAFLPPALPPHSNSSSWSWQHRTLGGVEGEDTEQGARVGWPCSPALGLLLLPFLLSFPLTSALCPGGAGRRVEWRGKTRSKVQEWAGGGGDHGWAVAVAAAEAHDREGGTWVSEGCVH